ncbi:MAG: hypothetical protein M3349_04255 [Actinomycetota bacterium]|nr:hypothetical protein [Actinomycetota bacterium]
MIERGVIGILLILTGGALGFISLYLIKAGWRVPRRRLWPPWRAPTELKLANVFVSLGLFLAILGTLVFGGTRPLPAWGIAMIAVIAFAVGILWLDFANPPSQVMIENGDHDGVE